MPREVIKFLGCVILLGALFWLFQMKVSGNIPLVKKFATRRRHENSTKPWLVVYWSTFFGRRLDLHEKWPKGECPVSCELTSDISRAKEADGFVVHARDADVFPPIDSAPWILQIRENPIRTPILKDAKFMSKFNLLKSYRLDFGF